MESTRGNTHSVTFFPPGNVFFGSMISTMHPLTTNTAAVLPEAHRLETCATGECATGMGSPEPRESLRFTYDPYHSRVCQWPCMAHESAGTLVTGRASMPSARATYNCITPLRSEPNRSERPSGEGVGW